MPEFPDTEAHEQAVIRALRTERLRQAMTLRELARRSAISPAMISLVERDLCNPTLHTLLQMARALQVDLGGIIQEAERQTTRRQPGKARRRKSSSA